MADGIDFSTLQAMGGRVLGAGEGMISAAVGMGGELLQANQKLSDYSSALSSNTKVFGKLGGVINGLVQFAEQSLEEYQTLTGIGATFGKEMVNIKRTAAELGVTTKDMIEILQNNSAGLRTFGGTTDQAISRFRAFSKEVLDSEVGTELRRLGFTAKDINETLITYNEIAQQDGLVNRRSAAEQAASARDFALQLDGLSKLTGKQREELADEMKKRRREGDVQAFLMGQSAEAQEAFMMATTNISNTMGPQFGELFKDLMIRGAPITEDTRNAFIALGGSADEFESTVASFRQGMQTNNFDGFNQSLTEAQGAFAGYLKTEEARNTAMLGGLSGISTAMGRAYESSYDFANSLDAAAEDAETPAETLQRIQSDIGEQQAIQMATTNGLLDKTIELQENLRELTITATTQVLPRLEEAAMRAINMFQEALPSASEMVNQLNNGISNMFSAAEANVYPGMSTALSTFGAATDEAIGALGDEISGSNAELSETVDTSIDETEASLSEQVVATGGELSAAQAESDAARAEAEAALQEAQTNLTNLTAQGFTEMEPPIRQAREAVDRAEAALQSTIEAGNARVMQAVQSAATAYTNARVADFQRTGSTRRGFAGGGRIDPNEVGVVGEAGPEFIAGPANVMSAKTSMGVLQNLLKSIKSVDKNVQESAQTSTNQLSTMDIGSSLGGELGSKFDRMIAVMEALYSVESEAAGTARRTFRATKGLQGNMLKGIGA